MMPDSDLQHRPVRLLLKWLSVYVLAFGMKNNFAIWKYGCQAPNCCCHTLFPELIQFTARIYATQHSTTIMKP